MKKLSMLVLMVTMISLSGCVGVDEKPQETVTETVESGTESETSDTFQPIEETSTGSSDIPDNGENYNDKLSEIAEENGLTLREETSEEDEETASETESVETTETQESTDTSETEPETIPEQASSSLDLSDIQHEEVKALINQIYSDNGYTSYEFIEVTEETDIAGQPTGIVDYVVKLDGDYYVISTGNGDTYAIKDEWGIYGSEE